MRTRRRFSAARRGIAIVIALMAILVLSILGTSLLFTTRTESLISRHYAAEVDALFAANAGLQMGIKHAMDDATWDGAGQWSNAVLAVGGPLMANPPATATCPWGACQDDGAGTVTGRPRSFYYDLRYYQSVPARNFQFATSCAAIPCTAAEWSLLADEPYTLPPASDQRWTESGPGFAASHLPNGASYRLFFQSVPEGTTFPPSPFRTDRIRILSVGMSGTAIAGKSGVYDAATGTMMGGVERRATRVVQASFSVKDIGIWSNAFFASSASAEVYQGGATLRGSLHIRNETGADPGITFTGNASLRNNYAGIDETYILNRIPIPSGSPHGLEADLRLRAGTVRIQAGSSSVGTATDEAPATALVTTGKGSLDGVYVGTGWPKFSGANGSNHYEDQIDDYDASGFALATPDYNQAEYRDACSPQNVYPTAAGLEGYPRYLKGVAGTRSGVHALDMSPLGANLVFNDTSALAAAIGAAAMQGAIAAANDDEFPGTPRTPAGASHGNVDIVVDPASGAVGVFKHLPSRNPPESNDSCLYGTDGGGHGFLWIPPGSSVAAGATAQAITDFIYRNFARYDGTLRKVGATPNPSVNAFLGRAPLAGDAAAIASGPYFDGPIDATLGRLLIHGVVYIQDRNIGLGGACPQGGCNKASIAYMGRGSFAVGDSSGGNDADVWLYPGGRILSYRLFPCTDALGVMSPDNVQLAGPGSPDTKVMAAIYGRNQVTVQQNTEMTGTYVTFGACGGCFTGNGIEHNQVPDLARCLPPRMIGDWSFYVTRSMSWSER